MDATMMPQAMAQAPFYYYSAESKNAHQMGMYPMVPTLPSTPIYSRPNSSSCSQPPTLMSNGPSVMTPIGSPAMMARKPGVVLENDFCDGGYLPSTPPLSTSGSTIGSPKSFDILQTPMNPMFSGLDGIEEPKDVLESAEHCVLDWSSCGSPPMTPVYLQSQPCMAPSLNTSDLASISCPSLSPSPAPYARSVTSEQDVDFCDPRNLTVSAASNPTLAPEFHVNGLGEEQTKADQVRSDALIAPQATLVFNPSLSHSLPAFEELSDLSDLESEDDFVNSLVNIGEHTASDVGRPRACTGSSVVSLGHGSFIGDEDLSFEETFQFPSMPSPPSTTYSCSSDSHKDKRQKKSNGGDRTVAPIMAATAAEAEASNPQEPLDSASPVSSESHASSGSEGPSTPLPAPTNRRGRKQSLTEDPSKTFVCDLCNRRFRRQEHLKRHYRSLHTQEKPFECNECGKKFSRSDNLAQHARTHAGGAIVMNLIEEGEVPSFDTSGLMATPSSDDYSTYGKVLFQIASEVPGSASELSSEETSDQGKKKRKRSD